MHALVPALFNVFDFQLAPYRLLKKIFAGSGFDKIFSNLLLQCEIKDKKVILSKKNKKGTKGKLAERLGHKATDLRFFL